MSNHSDIKRPPGPQPPGGRLARLRLAQRLVNDTLGLVRERFANYGDIYYVNNSSGGLYVTQHPDHFRDILVTHGDCFSKQSSAFARLRRVLGQGLLTTDGAVWKRHRRMIQPAFMKPRLAGYAPMMVEEAARTADSWQAGQTIDLGADLAELTLRVVSRSLFSYEVADDVDAITGAVAVLQDGFSRLDLLPRWLPTPRRRRARRALAAIDDVMYRLIAQRRAGGDRVAAAAPDLLQMLLDVRDEEGDGGGLSDNEIRDQLVTFYLAGHETTSQALTWTLYLLSQHPDIEARVQAELETVLGERDPSFADADALVFTELVVRESMRLYPPVFAIARMTEREASIGDYTIPPSSEVALWFYFAHRDARWFPEPERFDPDRFANDSAVNRPRHAYLPFGGGARMCIGKTFATIEAVLILATLLRRRRLQLAPGHPVDVQTRVTLLPRHGMKMVAEER